MAFHSNTTAAEAGDNPDGRTLGIERLFSGTAARSIPGSRFQRYYYQIQPQ